MVCPMCGTENETTAIFCDQCGAKITPCDHEKNGPDANYCEVCGAPLKRPVCPQCNSQNPYVAKFCEMCGSALGT